MTTMTSTASRTNVIRTVMGTAFPTHATLTAIRATALATRTAVVLPRTASPTASLTSVTSIQAIQTVMGRSARTASRTAFLTNAKYIWSARTVRADYLAIQDAIDAASDGYTITLCDGAFTGDGNRDIDFLGKAITVRSQSGIPENCIIDCEGAARGFYFHSGEGAGSLLTGITIRNGHVDDGAGIYCAFSSPTIENCVIANNSANIEGGGMYCESASPALANCLFYANSSGQHGGALGCSDSSPTLVNCTLSGNWANTEGGGIYVDSSSPILTNCILWADTPDEIYIASSDPNDPGDPNDPNDPGDPNDVAVTYSDVEGGWPGDGNIDANPFFVDPSGENCHLGSLSPCIDTGDANSDFSPGIRT